MDKYVVLLRGINVGGKNKVKMADLRTELIKEGFDTVQTYIQSGNIVVESNLVSETITQKVATLLTQKFTLDTTSIKILTLNKESYELVIAEAPENYGRVDQTVDYRYDVLFLIDITVEEAMKEVETRGGIDQSWCGTKVIYYRRPGPTHPDYTKSALSKLAKKNIYQSMTVRNWKTTTRLWEMIQT